MELSRPTRVFFPRAWITTTIAPLNDHVGESDNGLVRIQGG